ncbi:MAG: mechanosensitive ion channel family protein [Candidatus Wukongarchaeota archaeon]|nr:mechanosensitive ion channel [Candidatus Wukongarchaeota archaeon]
MVVILEDVEEWLRDNLTLEKMENIIIALLILVVTYFVARFISRAITRVFEREKVLEKVSKAASNFLRRIVFYIIILFGVFAAIGQLGVSVSGYLALLGVTGVVFGLVIAFGFQEAIGNLIAGFIILSDKPFTIGDIVKVGGSDVVGKIENIGLRSTWIRQIDNSLAIVANSQMIHAEVINYTTWDPNIMLRIPMGVAYGSNVKLMKEILLKIAKETQGVLSTPEPEVIFKEYGDSSLNFELWAWIDRKTTSPLRTTSAINWRINEEFEAVDIEIPFPQRDLHLKSPSKESLAKILGKEQ